MQVGGEENKISPANSHTMSLFFQRISKFNNLTYLILQSTAQTTLPKRSILKPEKKVSMSLHTLIDSIRGALSPFHHQDQNNLKQSQHRDLYLCLGVNVTCFTLPSSTFRMTNVGRSMLTSLTLGINLAPCPVRQDIRGAEGFES